MAGSLNRVTLLGNLGKDPEVTSLTNGGKVCKFSIATSESWTDKNSGEKKEKTEWHNIVIWQEGLVKVAEKYLKKGSKVLIEGKMQTRKWEKDGIDRYSTEVVLQGFGSSLILLGDAGGGRRSDGDSDSGIAPARTAGTGAGARQSRFDNSDMDDDIPF